MFKYKVRPAGVADFTAVYKMNERILDSKVSKKEAERVYRNTLMDADQAYIREMPSVTYTRYRSQI